MNKNAATAPSQPKGDLVRRDPLAKILDEDRIGYAKQYRLGRSTFAKRLVAELGFERVALALNSQHSDGEAGR